MGTDREEADPTETAGARAAARSLSLTQGADPIGGSIYTAEEGPMMMQ